MTKNKTIKVVIPSQTVEINAEAWALEFGLDVKDVRADVKSYFDGFCRNHVEYLGLGKNDGTHRLRRI